METVSAIITTHKREPAIVVRAITSVINQSYPELEIIVVDDSPEDYPLRMEVERSVSQLQSTTGKEIRYIKHDRCKGACAARNTGLHNCRGSIVGYLDDDDEWLPGKVEKMLKGFTSEDIALVYCDNEVYTVSSNSTHVVHRKKYRGKVYDSLIIGNYIGSTSFPLIRRRCLLEIGEFDEQMQSSQDYDVWLRLALKYEIDYVDDVLVRYYIHEGEQITKNPDKKVNGLERLNKKNSEYLDAHAEAYWWRHMKIIPYYLMKGDRAKALRTWKNCARKCPFKVKGNLAYLSKIIMRRSDR